MKVEDHFSSEPPLEYNEDQMTFKNQGHLLLFLLTWELQEYYAVSSRLVRLLRLVPERKTDKETPECSRLEFLFKTLIHSQNSVAAAEVPTLKISYHKTSLQ